MSSRSAVNTVDTRAQRRDHAAVGYVVNAAHSGNGSQLTGSLLPSAEPVESVFRIGPRKSISSLSGPSAMEISLSRSHPDSDARATRVSFRLRRRSHYGPFLYQIVMKANKASESTRGQMASPQI